MQAPPSGRYCKDIILPTQEAMHTFRQLSHPDVPEHHKRLLRAAYMIGRRWPQHATVKIGFLEGTDYQKNLVKKVVQETYAPLMNLNLVFVEDNPEEADMRVTFDPNNGSWSYLGTDAKNAPKGEATLNLGWLDDDPADKTTCCHGVIKHEFGHGLAAWIHEHQNPRNNPLSKNWNKPVIYKDLEGPPNNWDKATIDQNMFKAYDVNHVRGSSFNSTSIMAYSWPASWTLNGIGTPVNQFLSKEDKEWLQKEYPKSGKGGSIDVSFGSEENGGGESGGFMHTAWFIAVIVVGSVLAAVLIGVIIWAAFRKRK